MYKLSPQAFYRLALTLCGAWLLVVYPLLNWFCWEKLPDCMHGGSGDFEQYYWGGIVARHGLWNHLYPIPKPLDQVPKARPLFADPFTGERKPFVYDQYNSKTVSDVPNELLPYCPSFKKHFRYIYPPPLAIYLMPLGYFDFETSRKIWFQFMCAGVFGTALFATKLTRILWGQITHTEGWILTLTLLWSALGNDASTSLAVGNVSPLLAFLIAGTTYAWVRGRELPIAAGLILLLPFKGIGLSWCPLLFFKPVRWKALITMAGMTLLINAVTLYLGGYEIYRHFFVEVLPKMGQPAGFGLPGKLMEMFGQVSQPVFTLIKALLLAALYYGFWRCVCRSRDARQRVRGIIATFAGTMSLFCLLNPVVWLHYWTQYVLLPFFGWIVWEARQAGSFGRRLILIMLSLNFILLVDGIFVSNPWWQSERLHSNEMSGYAIVFGMNFLADFITSDLTLIEPAFALILALRRLFSEPINDENKGVPVVSALVSFFGKKSIAED